MFRFHHIVLAYCFGVSSFYTMNSPDLITRTTTMLAKQQQQQEEERQQNQHVQQHANQQQNDPTNNLTEIRTRNQDGSNNNISSLFCTVNCSWPSSNIVYAHLHYMKTAGSNINGALAAKYERVCGHKGYSYDAYQFNQRIQNYIPYKNRNSKNMTNSNNKGVVDVGYNPGLARSGDFLQKFYDKTFNRGRVPLWLMDEIGYENCDYISMEIAWNEWSRFDNLPLPNGAVLEIHVPCREPLSQLMSACAFRNHPFDCNTTDLLFEIKQCVVEPQRFSFQLEEEQLARNRTLKCFDPMPVDRYLEYMGQRLQPKRVPAPYIARTTNQRHDQQEECIWKSENAPLAQQVIDLLLQTYPYYGWCSLCMSDPQRNLLFSTPSS